MRRLSFAILLSVVARPAFAGVSSRVELTPELGSLGASPAASAVGAVPLKLAPNTLIPSLAFAPHALAAVPGQGRPLLIKSLAAPAPDASKLSAGDAEKDFNARAQLDAPAALGDSVPAAPSAEKAPGKPRLTLVPSEKTPAKRAAAPSAEGLHDLVATPESLRALAERGESGLLIQTTDGRWLLAPRDGAGASYPTPEEIEASAGKGGRSFVFSKSGLVEWNSTVPEGLAASLSSGLNAWAAKVPGLYPFVLARAGVAARRTSWNQAVKNGLDAGEAPLNEAVLVAKTIPALIASEFPVVAAKLGRGVDAAYQADVLKRSNGYRMYWHSATTYKDHPDNLGIPDGHFRFDFGIRLMVKPDWRKLKDLSANFRPLFAHEYVHWLQNEGFISNKYGAEIAAVAVEILRAIELVGLEAVRDGRAGTVHAGNFSSFESGRAWARAGFGVDTMPYSKGVLAGAAYEAGVFTGRPEAAWEFLNLVIAVQGALEPAAAWARVVGAK